MAAYVPITDPAPIVITDNIYDTYIEINDDRADLISATKICTTLCCAPIILQMMCIILCTFLAIFNMICTFVLISSGEITVESLRLIKLHTLVCSPMIALCFCLTRIRLLMN